MNGDYELVMQASTVELLLTCSKQVRQRLLDQFYQLRKNPFVKGIRSVRDLSGREHQVIIVGQWEVLFWSDHAVKEVRIVRLRKTTGSK